MTKVYFIFNFAIFFILLFLNSLPFHSFLIIFKYFLLEIHPQGFPEDYYKSISTLFLVPQPTGPETEDVPVDEVNEQFFFNDSDEEEIDESSFSEEEKEREEKD